MFTGRNLDLRGSRVVPLSVNRGYNLWLYLTYRLCRGVDYLRRKPH
jgi:hypothetical protein